MGDGGIYQRRIGPSCPTAPLAHMLKRFLVAGPIAREDNVGAAYIDTIAARLRGHLSSNVRPHWRDCPGGSCFWGQLCALLSETPQFNAHKLHEVDVHAEQHCDDKHSEDCLIDSYTLCMQRVLGRVGKHCERQQCNGPGDGVSDDSAAVDSPSGNSQPGE